MKRFILAFPLFLAAAVAVSAQELSGEVRAKSREDLLQKLPAEAAYLLPEFRQSTLLYQDGSKFEANVNVCLLDNSVRFINEAGDTLLMANAETVKHILTGDSLYLQVDGFFVRQLMVYGQVTLSEHRRFEFEEPEQDGGYSGVPAVSTARTHSPRQYNPSMAYTYEAVIPYKVKTEYVLTADGKSYSAKVSHFKKLFPERKKEISRFIKDHDLDLSVKEDLMSLFYFCTGAE